MLHTRRLCSVASSLLPYTRGRFDNAHVDLGQCCVSSSEFRDLLSASIHHWQENKMQAAWLKVPIEQSGLIWDAAAMGFHYHHALKDHAMLVQWLRENKPNRIADYASHQVGACGVVLREDTQEVLVTKDRHKVDKWKFPGGLSDHAEDIADTAVREVKEETGIETQFESLLAVRQQHHQPNAFDCSDLYFVCRLYPLSLHISHCDDEILDCQWLPIGQLVTGEETTLLTQHICHLLGYGLRHGFNNVDLRMEELPAIHRGLTYKLFSRKLCLD